MDGQTDGGQLAIRKAPLPDGKAELKNLLAIFCVTHTHKMTKFIIMFSAMSERKLIIFPDYFVYIGSQYTITQDQKQITDAIQKCIV